MPKKKPSKNAFSFYLDDAMIELPRKGIFVKSKAHAVPHVSQKWKEMTAEEKAPYEEKARRAKMMSHGVPRVGRLDCTGNRIDDRIDMDKVLINERREQKKFLLDRWQAMRLPQIMEEIFYFVSFQSYFECPDEEGYQPCEIAVVEYSLSHGITNEFHAMINPGRIKLGMGAEAKIISETTHKIPTYSFELGRKDYIALWNELLEFVNPGFKRKIFPPLFSKISELKKTKACLHYLADLAGKSNRLTKVYQWEGLAVALYEQTGMQPPSVDVIGEGAESSMYDYERNTKCHFHDDLECVYCAVLTVKKCCFWLSDALTKIYGFEITETHLPVRSAPQYSVIRPEDLLVDMRSRRKFLGSKYMSRYDPNLPASLTGFADDLLASESSACSSVPFNSRDIRYRKSNTLASPVEGVGRGMAVSSAIQNAAQPQCGMSETASIADTDDDVGSTIFVDSDSDTTNYADDEKSIVSIEVSKRAPVTAPKVIQHEPNSRLTLRKNQNMLDIAAGGSALANGGMCCKGENSSKLLVREQQSSNIFRGAGGIEVDALLKPLEEIENATQKMDGKPVDSAGEQVLHARHDDVPVLLGGVGRGKILQRF